MRWDAVAAPDLEQDVILFDGDCVLCSRWARFVHRHDAAHRFKFTAIQSPYGRALAMRFGIDPENPETNLAVVNCCVYFKADTPLAILGALPGWRWAGAGRVAPRSLRNWVYDRIARRRYAWFGRRAQCWAGEPAFKLRILEFASNVTPLHSQFETALGAAFQDAHPAVRMVHCSGPVMRFSGVAKVDGASSPLAAFFANLFGMPGASDAIPVQVTMRLSPDLEIWSRRFGERRMESRLRAIAPGIVRESFGPFDFDMKVGVNGGVLAMTIVGWRMGPMPLPAWLAPRSTATESEDDQGRFRFDVPIALPLIGQLTHYSGWLIAEEVEVLPAPSEKETA